MSLLLGLVVAASFGSGDFLGGVASTRAARIAVLITCSCARSSAPSSSPRSRGAALCSATCARRAGRRAERRRARLPLPGPRRRPHRSSSRRSPRSWGRSSPWSGGSRRARTRHRCAGRRRAGRRRRRTDLPRPRRDPVGGLGRALLLAVAAGVGLRSLLRLLRRHQP